MMKVSLLDRTIEVIELNRFEVESFFSRIEL
jgi:hypothetical protein